MATASEGAEERWGYKVHSYRGPPIDGGKALVSHVVWVMPGQDRAYELVCRLHATARQRTDILRDDRYTLPFFFFDQLLPSIEIDGFPLMLTHVAIGGVGHPALRDVARRSHFFVVHESAPNTDFVPQAQRSHVAWIAGDEYGVETLKPPLLTLTKGIRAHFRDDRD